MSVPRIICLLWPVSSGKSREGVPRDGNGGRCVTAIKEAVYDP